MKENLRIAMLRGLRAILFMSAVIAAGWTPTMRGQMVGFAAPVAKGEAKVSVRELQIPGKARDEFERGLRRLAKRDAAGSWRHFDAAIRIYPEFYEGYYHEGIAALLLQNNEEALRCFQKAIDLSSGGYAPAQFGYGLALMRMGKSEQAESVVRQGLESDPNNSDGHVVLGFVLLKLDRPDEAEQNAREALEANGPNSAKGYLVLSDLDAKRQDYDEEVRDLDAYLKLRPGDPNKTTLRAVRDLARRLAAKNRLSASK